MDHFSRSRRFRCSTFYFLQASLTYIHCTVKWYTVYWNCVFYCHPSSKGMTLVHVHTTPYVADWLCIMCYAMFFVALPYLPPLNNLLCAVANVYYRRQMHTAAIVTLVLHHRWPGSRPPPQETKLVEALNHKAHDCEYRMEGLSTTCWVCCTTVVQCHQVSGVVRL